MSAVFVRPQRVGVQVGGRLVEFRWDGWVPLHRRVVRVGRVGHVTFGATR